MTPADLRAAGRALHGDSWQPGLRHDLRISDVSLRRWLAGYCEVPDGVERDVIELLAARQVERILDIIGATGANANGIALVVYHSDYDLWKISGDEWSAKFHGRMIGRMIELLRAQSIAVRSVPLDARDYFRWLGGRQNSPSARAEYAAVHAAPYAS
jgi:hypothetical protein